jgi:hypothetical protein
MESTSVFKSTYYQHEIKHIVLNGKDSIKYFKIKKR